MKTLADLESPPARNHGETVPVTYLRPVEVPNAMGGLADMAVYESGVAALTPESARGDLLARTGLEAADLYVCHVPEGSAEWRAGIRPGDRITEVDHVEMTAWSMVVERLMASPAAPHMLAWTSVGQRKTGTIQLRREDYLEDYGENRPRFFLRMSNWAPSVPEPFVENPTRISYAFHSALEETHDVIRLIVVGAIRMAQGKVSLATIGGPIAVYDVVGDEGAKGVSYFVWAMAVISINLGLINLLPIPVLDGGHMLFFLFEALLRRPLPLRVRELASLAGLIVLLCLMAIAFKNDVERRWDVIRGHVKRLIE